MEKLETSMCIWKARNRKDGIRRQTTTAARLLWCEQYCVCIYYGSPLLLLLFSVIMRTPGWFFFMATWLWSHQRHLAIADALSSCTREGEAHCFTDIRDCCASFVGRTCHARSPFICKCLRWSTPKAPNIQSNPAQQTFSSVVVSFMTLVYSLAYISGEKSERARQQEEDKRCVLCSTAKVSRLEWKRTSHVELD